MPAAPKSTSSGWARTTRARSGTRGASPSVSLMVITPDRVGTESGAAGRFVVPFPTLDPKRSRSDPDGRWTSVETDQVPVLGRRRRLAVIAAILLVATGLLATGVLAVFTDTATSDGNTFGSGNVDLTVSPATAAITLAGMAPGDRITQPLLVTNSGALDLRYALRSTTTENVLASALRLTIKSGVATCSSTGFAGSGTVIYGPGDLGNTVPLPLVGAVTQGQDPGDRILAAGGNETLCLDVQLPLTADNAAGGRTTTATFTFLAEQTAANP